MDRRDELIAQGASLRLAAEVAAVERARKRKETFPDAAAPGELPLPSTDRLVGQDHFDALTPEEQDAKFGPDLATALRDGKVALADIVTTKNGFLVRKPIDDLDL